MGLSDILTYNGNSLDIILNYLALLATCTTFICLFYSLPEFVSRIKKLVWFPIFLGLAIFQVVLCTFSNDSNCTGISIIWSAIDAINVLLFYQYNIKLMLYSKETLIFLDVALITSLLYSLALWIYYGITAAIIDTIAHICSILLGLLIGGILICCKMVTPKRKEHEALLDDESIA